MIIIAHRGNTKGPNKDNENKIFYIENAIKEGYYVEIDLWYINNKLFLGHDNPTYEINLNFLTRNKKFIFCHCKNIEALYYILNNDDNIECFFHDLDECVLTSKKNIWTFPGKTLTNKSICVMPEKYNQYSDKVLLNCYGICTDYAEDIKNKFNL